MKWKIALLRIAVACGIAARIALAVGLGAGLSGCSRPAPPQVEHAAALAQDDVIPVADRPPAALVDIGGAAKWLFNAADAAEWSAAENWLDSINESASILPDQLSPADVVARLQSRLEDLRRRVAARDRIGTMEDANRITRLVAELSHEFQTDVPYQAVLLGYYGRQLALGIAAGRPSTLTRATTDLRSTWDALRGTIEMKGWTEEAMRFTDIVVQLEGATRPAGFVAPVRAELAEADRIEKLFRSSVH